MSIYNQLDYDYEFNRIEEKLIFEEIQSLLNRTINFPSSGIYFQVPSHEYSNSRSLAADGLEENRYPSLCIYTTSDEDDSSLGDSYDIQQSSYSSSGLVTIFESDYVNCMYLSFSLQTLNKRDFTVWKKKLKLFFHNLRNGFVLTNDILPQDAGRIALVQIGSSIDAHDEQPFESIFSVKCVYRIYKEYAQKLFLYYSISGAVSINRDIDLDNIVLSDDFEQWYSG
jgi:hypothetical protein